VQIDMSLVPEAVKIHGAELAYDRTLVPKLVERGLTAQLVKQSFVTGLLTVDLDFRKDAERTTVTDLPQEIPTVPTDFEQLARRARDIDLPATVEALQGTLASLERILSAPETSQTLRELPLLVSQLRGTLAAVETQAGALSGSVRTSVSESADSFERTLASVQRLASTLEHEASTTAAAARTTLEKTDRTLTSAQSAL